MTFLAFRDATYMCYLGKMDKEKLKKLLSLLLEDCVDIQKMISAGAFLAALVPQQNGASTMSVPLGFAFALTAFFARAVSQWARSKD